MLEALFLSLSSEIYIAWKCCSSFSVFLPFFFLTSFWISFHLEHWDCCCFFVGLETSFFCLCFLIIAHRSLQLSAVAIYDAILHIWLTFSRRILARFYNTGVGVFLSPFFSAFLVRFPGSCWRFFPFFLGRNIFYSSLKNISHFFDGRICVIKTLFNHLVFLVVGMEW